MLVLEAAPLGDLHELVQSRRRLGGVPLAERFICSLFTQIASAVVHLHAHGVVHRDLKSLNVVLFAEADAVATARGILRREEDAMWQDVGSSGETYRSVPIGAIRAKICDLGVSRGDRAAAHVVVAAVRVIVGVASTMVVVLRNQK